MIPSNDPRRHFEQHHQQLIDTFTENRDAVLNPNQEYTHHDFTTFLGDDFLSHISHEEEILYQRADEAAGTELATASLREDHREIERRIGILAEDDPDGASLPLTLHELSALVRHHFQKEEEILLPYLNQTLSQDDFTDLLETFLAHDDT